MVLATLEGRTGGAAALATVIHRGGSAPQATGAKLLLLADGRVLGTVGGGAIEQRVLEACQEVLHSKAARRVAVHLVRDLAMCCGGDMEVFVEYVGPEPRLVVIGAGHVAQALVPMATAAGFRVDVVDDREDLLALPAFATARTLAYDGDELDAAKLDLNEHSYVLVMTRDHQRDEQALGFLLAHPHRYLGMIGSRRKVHTVLRRILARARERNRPEPDVQRLRAPIGLAIGAVTPGEIAVSVLAELIADYRGGSTEPLDIVERVRARGSVELDE